uniref:TM2 domain-containing protein CG10795-like n=1 Tax=Hirondellea gigas TaxID=1518452 RepID=A0A6A7FWS5_9CRUS
MPRLKYLIVVVSVVFNILVAVCEQQLKQPPEEKLILHQPTEYHTDCSTLLPGQFLCLDRNIDPATQQPRNCNAQLHLANVTCQAAPGIICHSTQNSTFTGQIPCKPTNGYSFETALLLSVFLGMFGLDRFYLGYHAIGLAKLCTLGFLFLGQLIDVVLIATQTLGPADGSHYIISYYGAAINVISIDNDTFRTSQPDWPLPPSTI